MLLCFDYIIKYVYKYVSSFNELYNSINFCSFVIIGFSVIESPFFKISTQLIICSQKYKYLK